MRVFLLSSLLTLAASQIAAQTFSWTSATPESQGMSTTKLDVLKDDLAARKTKAFLVIRNDKIVYEWYAADHSAQKTHYTASMAKAIVGGLSLAVAISDGKITLDDPAAKFIPAWKSDPRKSRITVRHLGSHTSGVEDAESDDLPHDQLTGWKGDFWKRLDPPNDAFSIARDKAPLVFDPGAKLQYSNPGIALLSYCVTAAIHDSQHSDIRTLLRERVMRPIGVPDKEWSCGYGQTYTVDGLPLVGSWGGGGYTARAVASIGRLVLRQGDWDGQRILSSESVRQVTTDAGLPGNCGMGWWTNAAGRYAKVPKDAVWGAGAGDQILLVVHSLNLIMVRNGQALVTPVPKTKPSSDPLDVFTEFHDARTKILFEPLIDAVQVAAPNDQNQVKQLGSTAKPPYPPRKSSVITGIEWSSPESIVRRAPGCDNWPMTWGDDDQQYTAYGDGNGFVPKVPEKLSLGLARISGGPTDFSGVNLRSADAEQKGQGADGKKASGMLMVDGKLYMLVRNAGNSQLARSDDHGQSWKWADWKFETSFGCPTFLNFGKNYDGARDNFVYIYSHDADSAYVAADRMVLARVAKGQLMNRDAYEFLLRVAPNDGPIWTRQIQERGAVFEFPKRCYRSAISYNAGIKRYLWVQILPDTNGTKIDTRFAGGFAIYDAPDPWGPWTTVCFTEKWDVGPGETASFPTKWMSADGWQLHLVFSGEDSFSVRRATLRVSRQNRSFEPTSAYDVRELRGWKCFVNQRLAGEHSELLHEALDLLDVKLADIVRTVPRPALQKLQAIPIWIEVDDDRYNPCCCYHVSADWLRKNGFNPEKERSIEICNARRFIDWSQQQPWMILHELSHGFHHREFGYDEPRIVAAHQQAKQAGVYESVLRYNGRSERHYAMNNPMEYFSEASEAYFGVNDYFPFVRAELQRHDPAGFQLMEQIWGTAK